MKLIIFPLSVLIILSLLSLSGLGDTMDATFYVNMQNNPDGTPKVLYDVNGNPVCYYNGTAVAGQGAGSFQYTEGGATASWYNGSLTVYPLYYDSGGVTLVGWEDVQNPIGLGARPSGVLGSENFSISGSLGFIALLVVLMAVGTLVGLKFFGSGLSEFSVALLFKGTAFITIWGVFSILGYDLMFGTGQFLLFIVYFVLTVVYTLGIVFSVQGGESD